MKFKRGISGVIAMVLMIAITLVATGIVWGVVNNLINSKTKSSECIDVFEKVLINNYYTCYNSSSKELNVAVELKNVNIDSVLIGIYGESQSTNFELPSSGYSHVRPYNGSYGDSLTLPSQNSAVTYIVDINSLGIGNPSIIKISPKIRDYQCEVSDTIMNIEEC